MQALRVCLEDSFNSPHWCSTCTLSTSTRAKRQPGSAAVCHELQHQTQGSLTAGQMMPVYSTLINFCTLLCAASSCCRSLMGQADKVLSVLSECHHWLFMWSNSLGSCQKDETMQGNMLACQCCSHHRTGSPNCQACRWRLCSRRGCCHGHGMRLPRSRLPQMQPAPHHIDWASMWMWNLSLMLVVMEMGRVMGWV